MTKFYWCFKCEHVFNKEGQYDGKRVKTGDNGGYCCPLCGASALETLDWESFIFGPAAANNYPDEPIDGHHYPLYPVI